jgi:2-C-methyl-D-erythritol 2,4-cyclodiphosphate synthase/2-C-methyl-D-erythritol 4-phosphate cytidylyltransferase/2-C-methyl-D-erythritol 2,4-cyclodiphosphate synthase
MIRAGFGYDIHRLKRGRRFLLAGVEIPFKRGETGHSDGDVLAHAVSDALLGACALGDIGELYPPSDSEWKDADSMELLRKVYARVRQAGWKAVNLDCVTVCEKPKILPFRNIIRKSLADALDVSVENVFVKGKTAEGIGRTGKGKAVEAFAQCLLEKQ